MAISTLLDGVGPVTAHRSGDDVVASMHGVPVVVSEQADTVRLQHAAELAWEGDAVGDVESLGNVVAAVTLARPALTAATVADDGRSIVIESWVPADDDGLALALAVRDLVATVGAVAAAVPAVDARLGGPRTTGDEAGDGTGVAAGAGVAAAGVAAGSGVAADDRTTPDGDEDEGPLAEEDLDQAGSDQVDGTTDAVVGDADEPADEQVGDESGVDEDEPDVWPAAAADTADVDASPVADEGMWDDAEERGADTPVADGAGDAAQEPDGPAPDDGVAGEETWQDPAHAEAAEAAEESEGGWTDTTGGVDEADSWSSLDDHEGGGEAEGGDVDEDASWRAPVAAAGPAAPVGTAAGSVPTGDQSAPGVADGDRADDEWAGDAWTDDGASGAVADEAPVHDATAAAAAVDDQTAEEDLTAGQDQTAVHDPAGDRGQATDHDDATGDEATGDEATGDEAGASTVWGYVHENVEVRGLTDTDTVVGELVPGQWYAILQTGNGWAHVVSVDGSLEGWADDRRVLRHT